MILTILKLNAESATFLMVRQLRLVKVDSLLWACLRCTVWGQVFRYHMLVSKSVKKIEVAYGEGTLRYSVDDDTQDLTPGQSVRTPKGSVHGFSNPFERVARALITVAPDIGPRYFEDVASVVNAGGPPDKVALVAVMHRYGLVPAA